MDLNSKLYRTGKFIMHVSECLLASEVSFGLVEENYEPIMWV